MPDDNVSKIEVTALATFLIVLSLFSGYIVYSLWSSASPAVELGPASKCEAIKTPTLLSGYPDPLSASTATTVLLTGCEFPQTTAVKVNGAPHASVFVDDQHVEVQLSAAELSSAGALAVTMSDGKTDFGVGALKVEQPTFFWKLAWLDRYRITEELQLFLLVIFTGSLGSCVYALKSLADYQGDAKLTKSWILYYIIQPLEGAGSALLVYLCIRGGFLSTAGADGKAVNQFGICAIAGLSGAFSDIAFGKLREVFETLFKPQDDRSGKIVGLTINTTTLPSGQNGQDYSGTLQASGGTPPLSWSVVPDLPTGLTLNQTTGTITGRPNATSPEAVYTFSVKDSASPALSATAQIKFNVV